MAVSISRRRTAGRPAQRAGTGHSPIRQAWLASCYRVSALTGVLLAAAAGTGLLSPGIYQGNTSFAAAAFRGADLVSLAIAVPVLAASVLLARRIGPGPAGMARCARLHRLHLPVHLRHRLEPAVPGLRGLALLSANLFLSAGHHPTDGPLIGLWALIAAGSLTMLLRYLKPMKTGAPGPLARPPGASRPAR